ncbi:CASP-like protein 1B1 [Dichanthelium oligosanthes]|uniref:CASP-like protein n=1 Tax=Dichanthelium oligosanthes TaxID=888268 RepID=A0A1E5VG62_9POAL|nr:CASP-like protein 1B1 [Dichanthelium oligosanthes]
MDLEHGSKKPSAPAAATTPTCSKLLQLRDRLVTLQPVLLRAAAALATVVAAAVMALNTQSYTVVVAIVGTRPLMQTFTAKFRDTPAFVYFVIANAIAGAYNLLVLLMKRLILRRRTASLVVHMLDMVIMALLATGAATAASMAELGKNGNLHARWNPMCDKFGSFCSRGGIAIVSSFIGVALMLALNLLSAASNAHRPSVVGQ